LCREGGDIFRDIAFSSQLIATFRGNKKRLWGVLVSKEIIRTLSHSSAEPLNQNSSEQQIMDNT
jgi:hypothetical protein